SDPKDQANLSFHLEHLLLQSAYGADVLQFYDQSLAVHKSGGDLREYLGSLEDEGRYDRKIGPELRDEEMDFVLQAGRKYSGDGNFARRLAYVRYEHKHGVNMLDGKEQQPWTTRYDNEPHKPISWSDQHELRYFDDQ